ncbi:hypothetical protein RA264_28775, partial [Pseudomonas syringae pv. tagetis]|uniref:hypothetical protein n=1 Tax=Pseudomonas syringae group genomosp. 7 TaxID=251699 RepID=UPI00376FC058
PGVLSRSGLPSVVNEELRCRNKSMNAELGTRKYGASLMSRVLASPAMLRGLAPFPLAVAVVSKGNSDRAALVAQISKDAV